jgi:uncharacterized cupredoxin-like copper-binding protein
MTSFDPDPPKAVNPSRHEISQQDLDRLLAHDAEQRRREREESRHWVNGLAIGGALLAALALLVSFFALTRSSGTTTTTIMAPAPASTPAAAPLGHAVTARLTEMKIADSVRRVAAGKVTFTVTNAGAMTHEYVILKTAQPAAHLPMSGSRASEAGHVGELGDLPAGATRTLSLNLKPGHYSIICNLPGHYAGGMYTDLTVR